MQIHPAADVMPALPDSELTELANDIKRNGLLVPIELLGGKIIDGRHRFKACKIAGVEPAYLDVALGGQTPTEYVWSLNGLRRHLTPSQRAAMAVQLLPELEKEADERMKAGGHPVEKVPEGNSGRARDKAARLCGVNPRYVSDAKKLKADSPERFAKVLSGELSLSDAKKPHVSRNSGENEWYTPSIYADAARRAMGGIDLDPASSKVAQKTVKAGQFYSIENDGLSEEWAGNVWLNPPYSKDLCSKFIEKLIGEIEADRVKQAVLLVNNATETAWFQMSLQQASAVCFPCGRIRFCDSRGKPAKSPLQGQMFLYFGDRTDQFQQVFSEVGSCSLVSICESRKANVAAKETVTITCYECEYEREVETLDESFTVKCANDPTHACGYRRRHFTGDSAWDQVENCKQVEREAMHRLKSLENAQEWREKRDSDRKSQDEFNEFIGSIEDLASGVDPKSREVLGVARDASADELKAKRRKLAVASHPDLGGDPDDFKKIQDAYENITHQ